MFANVNIRKRYFCLSFSVCVAIEAQKVVIMRAKIFDKDESGICLMDLFRRDQHVGNKSEAHMSSSYYAFGRKHHFNTEAITDRNDFKSIFNSIKMNNEIAINSRFCLPILLMMLSLLHFLHLLFEQE